MQSGISASAALQAAFKSLLAEPDPPTKRGLLVSISSSPEQLVPGSEITVSSPSSFTSDLANLAPLIKDNVATYIILRRDGPSTGGSCVAVTYVPDKAPVRQKTLFASTRLSLLRELGTEHFASTLFATSSDELTAAGWAKTEAHGSLAAPLSKEEQDLVDIKEAEALESTGTGARKGHVGTSHSLPVDGQAIEALKQVRDGGVALAVLNLDIPTETVKLVRTLPTATPADIQKSISATSPQFTFYSHASTMAQQRTNIFIYTCPTQSKIKERMLYASTRNFIIQVAKNDAGLDFDKRMEASDPDDVNEAAVLAELASAASAGGGSTSSAGASGTGFARPKRPGRR